MLGLLRGKKVERGSVAPPLLTILSEPRKELRPKSGFLFAHAGNITPLRLGDRIGVFEDNTLGVDLSIQDISDMLRFVRKGSRERLDGKALQIRINDRKAGNVVHYHFALHANGTAGELIGANARSSGITLTSEGGEIIPSHPGLLTLSTNKTKLLINNGAAEIRYSNA